MKVKTAMSKNLPDSSKTGPVALKKAKKGGKKKDGKRAEKAEQPEAEEPEVSQLPDVVNSDSKEVDEENGEEMSDEEEEDVLTTSKHKADMEKLKQSDPEFFKFMQAEDPDLLEFNDLEESEDEEEGADDESDEEMEDIEEKSRIPKAKKDNNGRLVFDGNMFSYLQDMLDPVEDKKISLQMEDIRLAVDAFQACVTRVGADVEAPKYVINEQTLFEATVRLCFLSLGDKLKEIALPQVKTELDSSEPTSKGSHTRSKKYKRYKPLIKQYLEGLLMFLNEVQTPAVIISTIKVIHRVLPLFDDFSKMARNMIKALVRIWTRKTLECRVMAYICMNQLIKSQPLHFSYLFKAAYLGFVSNSREVSAETWPLLQFMHRTFAELTLLSPDIAYPYAFVYIRQTAIHLRNAMISKKRKDLVQAIYNWQLMQCLYLWVRVVSKAHSVDGAEGICELAYPLTQIIIGVSRLYPSPRFLPLRFHCISMLIQLQANCTTFIPTLSLSCELLDEMERILRHKPKTRSGKLAASVPDLDSHLKVNSQQMEEAGWRNAACEHLFRLILQAAHSMCSQPAFPDMTLPVIFRLRAFVKSIRSADNARLFRGLIEKLEAHSKMVADTLLIKEVDLTDEMSVRAAKFALNDPDSPLRTYYRQWEKIWKRKQETLLKQDTIAEPTKNKKKEAAVKSEDTTEDVQEVKAKSKVRPPKRSIGPAASRADATIPDEVSDMTAWLAE